MARPVVATPYVDDPATWHRWDEDERRLTSAVSARLIELAGIAPGHRVIDVATGRGEPAVPAAHRVGPTGHVDGVDTQPAMLRMAAERAAREGVAGRLTLHVADAHALHGVPKGPYDAALARWALTYLDDPVRALETLRGRMKPGARLALATWVEPARVDYWRWPRELLARHVPVPAPDLRARHVPVPAPDLRAPGPFPHADRERLASQLAAAGWRAEHDEERHVAVMEARTADDLVAWCLAFGARRLLAGHPPAVAVAWEADVRAECGRWLQADGRYRLGGVTRLVVARVA